jgi:hypothetical protein
LFVQHTVLFIVRHELHKKNRSDRTPAEHRLSQVVVEQRRFISQQGEHCDIAMACLYCQPENLTIARAKKSLRDKWNNLKSACVGSKFNWEKKVPNYKRFESCY